MDDGRIFEMKPGDIFYIEPGHDSWVIGDEPYVSIHMMGAADYAANTRPNSDASPNIGEAFFLIPSPNP